MYRIYAPNPIKKQLHKYTISVIFLSGCLQFVDAFTRSDGWRCFWIPGKITNYTVDKYIAFLTKFLTGSVLKCDWLSYIINRAAVIYRKYTKYAHRSKLHSSQFVHSLPLFNCSIVFINVFLENFMLIYSLHFNYK